MLYFASYFGWDKSNSYFFLPFSNVHRCMAEHIVNPRKPVTIFCATRETGKSKIASVLGSVWSAFVNFRSYILLVSLEEELAKQNLRDVVHLIETPMFREYYGGPAGNIRADTFWQVAGGKIQVAARARRTGEIIHVCTIQCLGKGGSIIGKSEGAARPDFYAIDDLEDLKTGGNIDQVDKLQRWINAELLPGRGRMDQLAKRKAQVMWMGTPYGADSMLVRAMSKKWAKEVDVVRIPVLADKKIMGEHIFNMIGVPEGDSVWEEKFPKKEMEEERMIATERGGLSEWQLQYMMDYSHEKQLTFSRDKFRMITPAIAQKELQGSRLVCIIDMAFTKETHSDAVGISIVSHQKNSMMNVLRGEWFKMDIDETYDKCCEIIDLYGEMLEGIYVEMSQCHVVVRYFDERNMKRKGRNVELSPLKEMTKMNKTNRIIKLRPYHESGMLRFVEGDVTAPVRYQMLAWKGKQQKKAAVDDALDALAYQVIFCLESYHTKGVEVRPTKPLTAGEDAAQWFANKKKKPELDFLTGDADFFDGD